MLNLNKKPLMQTVSMLEFRQNAERILAQVRKGQRILLTYRGQAVARIEPIEDCSVRVDDPFYGLDKLADRKGRSLTNDQIDRIIYGR